jgi:hypothetical protein
MTVRDLLGAIAVLVAIALLVGGITRSCTFAPGGPTVDAATAPRVDAVAQLRILAGSTAFPLRVPALPADWRANSVDAVRVGSTGHRAVRTGYLTPEGRYLRVVQSDADEAALLTLEAQGTPIASGAVEVAGRTWVAYADDTREPIRIAEVPGPTPVRMLITGSGTEDEFRTLAAAATGGAILPTR